MKTPKELNDQVIYLAMPAEPRCKWTPSTPTTPAQRIELAPWPAVTVEIAIPAAALVELADRARRNRTGRATDGGLVAKVRR